MIPFVPADYSTLKRDIVIVGDGIAGLTCALALAEKGIKPLVITRGKGNTYLSQGGIAAAVGEEDSPLWHYLDTLRAGRLLNDEEAVKVVTYSGEEAISKLLEWGVPFDRNETFFELTLEAAHSKRRIFKVKDYTGRAIYEALHKKGNEYGIEFLKGELTEIYTSEGKFSTVLIKTEKGFLLIEAKILVLATGGAASLYAKNSNIQDISGDSIGAALRAGVNLIDTEFVQFHPTVLAGTGKLISEAVRGEGAWLVNDKGERFVDELSPRDEVARAIYLQIKNGRKVFLDFKPIVARGIKIEEKFPQIYSTLKEHSYDPYKELIPVEPAAHYFIGGIATDSRGRTAVENLYAIGECACTGLHGANRLASNSLLEGVVFGLRAATDIALKLPFIKPVPFKGEKLTLDTDKVTDLTEDLQKLKNLMWTCAGIVRNGTLLREALNELDLFDRLLSPNRCR
jgi:L-aspartate oxidase